MTTSEARRYQNLRAHLGYLKLNDAADALNTVLDAARHEHLSLTAALERLLEIEVEATCWSVFQPAGPRHRYCSERCRKTAHARRHNEFVPATEQLASPAPVATRACPHCGHDVSIVALLTTPEAARPTTSASSVISMRQT